MVLVYVVSAGAVVGGVVAIIADVEQHHEFADRLRRRFDPTKETALALSVVAAVGAAAAVGSGVARIWSKSGLQSFDGRIARYGAEHASALSTKVMGDISRLGSTPGVVTLAAIATAVELNREPTKTLPMFMSLVVGGQFVLSNGLKYMVERARPDISRLAGFSGTSFPSGHSTASSATFAAIALILTRDRSRRIKISGASIAAGLAAMIATTRMFLGVHWFTDVVAGLLLGWGWFALCSIATAEAFAEVAASTA
ncbi:MAG: phosphatase PAP2 family protein [Ilumatobacteraceae bacterium]